MALSDKERRVRICDRLFEMHNSINRAIAAGVFGIQNSGSGECASVEQELDATFEQVEAIVIQAKMDCERIRKEVIENGRCSRG